MCLSAVTYKQRHQQKGLAVEACHCPTLRYWHEYAPVHAAMYMSGSDT